MKNITEARARKMFAEKKSPVYIRLFHITYMSSYESIRLYSTTPYIGLRRYGKSDDFDTCVKNVLNAHGYDRKPLVAKKSIYYTGIYAKTDKERSDFNEFVSAVKEIYGAEINIVSDVYRLPANSFAVRFYSE